MSQIKAWEPQADDRGSFADEAALVAGLRAGRSEAFEVLHGAYAASIYGLALRIVDDQHEAQDVAQEVLIKVFRGLPGDETDLNLPAWLYRVTVNAAFDHVRARKRRPVTVVDDEAPEPVAAVDEFERAELSRRVESSLRELPKRQQLALVLRDVHGLSVGETASVLGLTKGSADVLLSRARTGFRRVFLAGVGSLRGRCDMADKALAAGVGRGERVPTTLLEHSKTCPDCSRAVGLWGAAPVGLGLLLPQVVLPAKLSFGATLAAAQAAGVAVSVAGPGAAAVGASAGGGAAASTSVAGGAATGGAAAASAGGAGILAALGSAAGVKIATLAVVATAAIGITGAASLRENAGPGPTAALVAAQAQGDRAAGAEPAVAGAGQQVRARARQLEQANGSAPSAHQGVRQYAAGSGGSAATGSERGGPSESQGGSGGGAAGGSSGGQSSDQAVTGQASDGAGAGTSAGSGSGAGGAGGLSGGAGGATSGGAGGSGGDGGGKLRPD